MPRYPTSLELVKSLYEAVIQSLDGKGYTPEQQELIMWAKAYVEAERRKL